MGDLDVLWNSYSHREIVKMVNAGPGASLTAAMEDQLKRVAQVLDTLSDQVGRVIQRTGADWHGGAADGATNAMWVLRNFDDGMYFTSNLAGIRAFGQSDSAGWVRANMPPVVEVHPPEPTGGLIDILNATVDYENQQAAAKQAEQRAREIMQQYTEATRERAAAMTPLEPVPQVVLEVSDSQPAGPHSSGGPAPRPRDRFVGPRESEPVGGPDGLVEPIELRSTNPTLAAPSAAPESTETAQAPIQGSTPTVLDSPERTSAPAAGGSGTAAPPPAGGGSRGRVEVRTLDQRPGRVGGPAGGRGVGGGPLVGGVGSAGRGGTTIARGGAASGLGATSPFGAGPGGRREEDQEHRARYGLPSAEHFEADDGPRDPHRAGWHVAPSVIGDGDEDGDNQ